MSEPTPNISKCDSCGYLYEPLEHDGVELDDRPDWECPECQAGIDHFQLVTPPDNDLEEPADPDIDDEPDLPTSTRAIYVKQSTPDVTSIKKKHDRGTLDTQPDFQRYQVWTIRKNSRLVESMLLNLPLPLFYVAQESDDSEVVIDGQQRLKAIFDFLDGEYALKGLGPFKEELQGKKFSDLDEKLQQQIEDCALTVVTILKESADDIRFDLFERLNTGAVSLNDQELRNSVYRGAYNEFLKTLSTEPDLRRLLHLEEPHKRMTDVEYVLRFMAFRHQTYLNHDDKKTGKFLNRTMAHYKTMFQKESTETKKERREAKKEFKLALQNAITVFGDNAFRRFVTGDKDDKHGAWEKRLNKALMDVQLYSFARHDRGDITRNRDAIHDMSVELMGQTEFSDLIRHTISEKKRVKKRFKIWDDALDALLAEKDLGPKGPRNFTRETRKKLFEADPKCKSCKQQIAVIDDAHVDHKLAWVKGGPTTDANAALLHRYCNLAKGSKTAEEAKKAKGTKSASAAEGAE